MARKVKSLRGALHRFQGKDVKVERQKKLHKDAQKKKNADVTKAVKEMEFGLESEDMLMPGETLDPIADNDEGEGLWSSGENDSYDYPVDVSRLDDSYSESESGEYEEAKDENIVEHNGEPYADNEEDDIPLSDLSDVESAHEDVIPHQRLTINNTSALERALSSFALPIKMMPFCEHQSLTTVTPILITDVEDDLKREVAFNAQALSAVREARSLLKAEGAPFSRPADYFAEMVKSDEHMGKIKAKLIDDAANKKAAQDARRQRDLKKFGKRVQNEKLKERAKAKKDMLDKVNLLKRKRQGAELSNPNEEDLFDVALEDATTGEKRDWNARQSRGGPQSKRQRKDQKFGFGGKKRFGKSGDAISSGDMSSYSLKKMKGSKTGASARLGKSRRAKRR